MLEVGEWAVYDDLETVRHFHIAGSVWVTDHTTMQVDQFVAWLNPKGVREIALKNTITKWWQHIAPGIRRRTTVSCGPYSVVALLTVALGHGGERKTARSATQYAHEASRLRHNT